MTADMTPDDYFQPIAEEVFGETLSTLGAVRTKAEPWLVRYDSAEWFVQLDFDRGEGPRYVPRVLIGPLPELSADAAHRQVEVLHLIPADSELRRYWFEWRYADPSEMRRSFERVRDEIFGPYVLPVLFDTKALAKLVETRTRLLTEQHQKEITDHNEGIERRKAQDALRTNDYPRYLAHMRNVSPDHLTKAELARIRHVEKLL